MMMTTRHVLAAALLATAVLGRFAPPAAAQGAVGAGPLTSSLAVTEPQSGVFNWGLVKLAPGMTIDEAGYDSNVFDEATDPKEDWMFRGSPDLAIFSLLRWVKVSAHAGAHLAYYKTYDQESSVGYTYTGRIDMMLSRFHPFIGAGVNRERTRPNGEIDTRADQQQEELSGGIAFDLGPHQSVYGAASRHFDEFKDGLEEGVDLPTTLNHYTDSYELGVRTALTPITNLTLSGSYGQDLFESLPTRNNETRTATASLDIGAEAAIAGSASVSYHDTRPVDPMIKPFRGVTWSGALSYSFLEIGRLGFVLNRGLEYSFDESEGYYMENTYALYYTQRLFGGFPCAHGHPRRGRSELWV
jgi:hypothetical protein